MTVEAMAAELLARNPGWLAVRAIDNRFVGTLWVMARHGTWIPVSIPITPGIDTAELIQTLSDALEVRNALGRGV